MTYNIEEKFTFGGQEYVPSSDMVATPSSTLAEIVSQSITIEVYTATIKKAQEIVEVEGLIQIKTDELEILNETLIELQG